MPFTISFIAMTILEEQRSADRFPLCCPLAFDKGRGLSHDISASGIYFSTEHAFRPSEVIRLVIYPHHSPMISCAGHVVRTEKQARGYSVAVHFTDFVFEVNKPTAV
jgi:hypothetical protein